MAPSSIHNNTTPPSRLESLAQFTLYLTCPTGEKIFTWDEKGNIFILHQDPKGNPIKNNSPAGGLFYTTRIADPGTGPKYLQPAGDESRVWTLPQFWSLKKTPTEGETVYLTEGIFKAIELLQHGIKAIALPGIWGFKKKGLDIFKPDLLEYLNIINPAQIIFIYDADFSEISRESGQITDKRPRNFFNSMEAFSRAARAAKIPAFIALPNKYDPAQKGIDDFLQGIENEEKMHEINALKTGWPNPNSFTTYSTNDPGDLRAIKERMHLARPDQFGAQHTTQINNKFTFGKGTYLHNHDSGKCTCIHHAGARDFVRIGDDFYKHIEVASDAIGARKYLKNISPRTIALEIGSECDPKKFYTWIPAFADFVNIPSRDIEPSPAIKSKSGAWLYNLHKGIQVNPAPGEHPRITTLIQHITTQETPEKSARAYAIMLDYLTIAWRRPAQKLPIIVLTTKEGDTGKSTFLLLLKLIWGDAATHISNHSLTSQFNEEYITSEFALVDEGLIDKRQTLEAVKSLSTSPIGTINAKYMRPTTLDLYLKFVFTSNDPDNCIPVSDQESRFWVLSPPSLQGKRDPNFFQEMRKEVPHFMHTLQNRSFEFKPKERTYFSYPDLHTSALDRLRIGSKSWGEKELYTIVTEIFQSLKIETFGLSLGDIPGLSPSFGRFQQWELKKAVAALNAKGPINSTYKCPTLTLLPDGQEWQLTPKKGRHYIFSAAEVLKTSDFLNI